MKSLLPGMNDLNDGGDGNVSVTNLYAVPIMSC